MKSMIPSLRSATCIVKSMTSLMASLLIGREREERRREIRGRETNLSIEGR